MRGVEKARPKVEEAPVKLELADPDPPPVSRKVKSKKRVRKPRKRRMAMMATSALTSLRALVQGFGIAIVVHVVALFLFLL
ncbi:MAG: hypothetical protein KDB07_09610, partial [Planctomycetes bacterium]|nr:hypothetical protein [Planctomycetota bacterium]